MNEQNTIGIIGLGYVGLPLAASFAKRYKTIGYDISSQRIMELSSYEDKTGELEGSLLQELIISKNLIITNNYDLLKRCDIFIITVPTPINEYNQPDLNPLITATRMVAKLISKEDLIIYESTVFPGATEEICIPILEEESGLRLNHDFGVGYSPERINPGDKEHTFENIIKVTSGSNTIYANRVDKLYKSVIKAGTYIVSSIKVAEAAKVIENTQRDLNIAFVNELSMIFSKLNIDTTEVLEAASTKWNFLRFSPGLVGGHCIGVDPYYLAQRAEKAGYFPEIILAGRRLNENMSSYIIRDFFTLLLRKKLPVSSSKILILGITFKENCPDIRNSKLINLFKELKSLDLDVDVFDPVANKEEVLEKTGISLVTVLKDKFYTGLILGVGHLEFININPRDLTIKDGVVYDIKSFFPKHLIDKRL